MYVTAIAHDSQKASKLAAGETVPLIDHPECAQAPFFKPLFP